MAQRDADRAADDRDPDAHEQRQPTARRDDAGLRGAAKSSRCDDQERDDEQRGHGLFDVETLHDVADQR